MGRWHSLFINMSFIKFLNISILILLFTPFIKSCEGEAPATEEAAITEESVSIEIAQNIDSIDPVKDKEFVDSSSNKYTRNFDNTETNNSNKESDAISVSEESNVFIKALVFAAYPEGIFTSVSGFGLILESFDDLYNQNFMYDWYFGLLIFITLIIHLIDLKKQSSKLTIINCTIIILTWAILTFNSRTDSLLWGFYLYSLIILLKTVFISKKRKRMPT